AMPSRLGYDLPRRAPPSRPSALPSRPTPAARGKAASLASLPLQRSTGTPDVRLLPAAALARAYRRALSQHGPELLDYGDARGHVRLRAALATMLSALRGVGAGADDVLITRGSQMALDLVARTLLQPGDVVAVEGLGY